MRQNPPNVTLGNYWYDCKNQDEAESFVHMPRGEFNFFESNRLNGEAEDDFYRFRGYHFKEGGRDKIMLLSYERHSAMSRKLLFTHSLTRESTIRGIDRYIGESVNVQNLPNLPSLEKFVEGGIPFLKEFYEGLNGNLEREKNIILELRKK